MVPFPFKKLSTSIIADFQVLDSQIEFDLDSEGSKIQYFNVASKYVDDFIASLGDYKKYFYSSFVSVGANVPPHIDIVDKVNINFYIETNDYKTTFYQGNEGCSKLTYADHGDGHVYKIEELEPIDSFVANPGDVYVLNGKVIHGVCSDSKLPRKFLQVSTNELDYDQVLDLLKC